MGMIFNISGSFILSFALNDIIKNVSVSIKALEYSNETPFVFTGMDKHRNKSFSCSQKYTYIGLILIAIGFVAQLIAFLIDKGFYK
jgi:hypothetical protein